MQNETQVGKVGMLAILDKAASHVEGDTWSAPMVRELATARAAVAELIAAINVAGRFLEETATCQSEPDAKITRHNVQLLRAALSAIRSEGK